MNSKALKIFRKVNPIIAILLALVLLWFVFKVYVIGDKIMSTDERRVEDLQRIVSALELYVVAHNGMYPESLNVLVVNEYLSELPLDPTTHTPYRYILSGRADFSICATLDDGTNKCESSDLQ